jgi:hypothetical protein
LEVPEDDIQELMLSVVPTPSPVKKPSSNLSKVAIEINKK